MKNEIRQPRQGRSIETKNKIIEASYRLFSEVGYYGTNTAEIAKEAGVSTGIVYGYFKDKRDILIDVLAKYIKKVFEPFLTMVEKLSAPIDFSVFIPKILEQTIKTHKNNGKMHEALHSLRFMDSEVNSQFIKLEDDITLKIASKIKALGMDVDNPIEKIHFAMDIVQSFSHEFVFDKHDYIDYTIMKKKVIETLIGLFD